MWSLLVALASAADPVIEGVDEPGNVVVKAVDAIDFTEIVDVRAGLEGPSVGAVTIVNPRWEGSFIRLRDSWDPEIARSLHAVK